TAKVEEQDIHISEMKSMLMNQEEEIREVKKVLEKVNKSVGVTGNNKRNVAVNIGVLIAIILSIIAIIL
ncbi:DegQ family regulator, partial [Bacillus cereus group sp. BceL130]|uniref:DegQ family regulator n=2 Tax=Bacillus TaxID=1386 RepID=UPI003F21211D